EVGSAAVEELPDQRDVEVIAYAPGVGRRVDADACGVGGSTDHLEEGAFAGPDLEDRLAGQRVGLDEMRHQLVLEGEKTRRECLALLVGHRVVHELRLEQLVLDESAVVTDGELQVTASEGSRLILGVGEDTTRDRDGVHPKERFGPGAVAGLAAFDHAILVFRIWNPSAKPL